MNQKENTEAAVVDEKINDKKKTSVVKTRNPSADMTMEQVLYHAIEMKTDPGALEKLFDLYERDEAKKAEKAFNKAMAKFQVECPIIEKKTDGAKNKARTEVLWRFASLSDIIRAAKEPLSQNGLSYSWDSEDIKRNDKVAKKTICTITHIAGHSKQSVFTSCLFETAGALMNDTQKEESTIEIGRRQSLKLALGIIVAGEDDEGVTGKVKEESRASTNGALITTENFKKITAMINKSATLETLILAAYNVATIELIKKSDFDDCIERIEGFKIANKKKESK